MPEVVFIGHQCNFSHSLITATVQELGGIISQVLPSFNDIYNLTNHTEQRPAMLVVDEPTFKNMSDDDKQFLLNMRGVSIGLAFCTITFGMACYKDHDLRMRSISIFPLDVRLDVWLSIVRLIAHGGSYLCPDIIAPEETENTFSLCSEHQETGLTQRQVDVLKLVADGHSNKRIADELGLSVHTVKLHLHNACLRLGAHNRTEAAMRFRANET